MSEIGRPTQAPTVREAIEASETSDKTGDESAFVKISSEKVAAAAVETAPAKEEYGFTKAQGEALLKLVNSMRTLGAKAGVWKE